MTDTGMRELLRAFERKHGEVWGGFKSSEDAFLHIRRGRLKRWEKHLRYGEGIEILSEDRFDD